MKSYLVWKWRKRKVWNWHGRQLFKEKECTGVKCINWVFPRWIVTIITIDGSHWNYPLGEKKWVKLFLILLQKFGNPNSGNQRLEKPETGLAVKLFPAFPVVLVCKCVSLPLPPPPTPSTSSHHQLSSLIYIRWDPSNGISHKFPEVNQSTHTPTHKQINCARCVRHNEKVDRNSNYTTTPKLDQVWERSGGQSGDNV